MFIESFSNPSEQSDFKKKIKQMHSLLFNDVTNF